MMKIIGHGTWYDKVAQEIVERERKLGRDLALIRTESGIGASGLPHIGSLADAARSHAVALAVREQDYSAELVAFSDDLDGLRKVPQGFPSQLNKYLGYPVTSIPDPFGTCHSSFGDHMSSLLLDALDKCNIEYRFLSGTEVYRRGVLNEAIEKLLTNAEQVGAIVKEEVGQEKFTEALPYFPICSQCGRIYTTKAYKFLPKEHRLLYVCEGMEIKGQWLDGCENKDETDYRLGEGKLSWKAGEFAARWATLGIRFEAYGKDIADSVRVNDRICREILQYEPPLHVQYEMFLDKTGKKISKSRGNVFTPQVWFRYGSPQSLLLLILKRFTGTRTLSITDIPRYMNELDALEDIYFGKKKISDEKERAKLVGLYEYCWGLTPPAKSSIHVPYNLLVYLAKVASKASQEEYIKHKLHVYGYIRDPSEDLHTRIRYALNWIEDVEEMERVTVQLTSAETLAVQELIDILAVEDDPDKIQNAIFQTARNNDIRPRRFFEILYSTLIGIPRGPKLGSYIVDVGRKNVMNRLKEMV